jgi:large subunit ribosomal protein L29
MRIEEVRDLNSEQRTKRLGEFKTELVRLKTMIKAGGMVENPARIKQLRRAIAQILTIEHEQKMKPKTKQAEVKPKKKETKEKKKEKKEKETQPEKLPKETKKEKKRAKREP